MHDDVDVVVCDQSVCFGVVLSIKKKIFDDGRIKTFDVEYCEQKLVFFRDGFEPVNFSGCVFPLV